MGSSLGAALFRLVLIVHEINFVASNGPAICKSHWPGSTMHCMRCMDDTRLFIVTPLSTPERILDLMASEILRAIYPPHLPLKPDSVNPCVGLELVLHEGALHWTAHVQGIEAMVGYELHSSQLISPYWSIQPPAQLKACVLAAFHGVQTVEFFDGVGGYCSGSSYHMRQIACR